MVRQSRLRVQKSKSYRRIIIFVLTVAVIAVSGWQLETKFEITSYIKGVIERVQKTPSENNLSRGTVYDRNLKQIAVTMERVSVYARKKEVESISETAETLSAILFIDRERLQKKLETGSLRVWVAEDISQDQESAVRRARLPGVYQQREQVRFYPNDKYAAHLTGYVDDNMGLAGVEFFYDRFLAGKKLEGKPQNNQLQDLVLTVDLKIQKILEDLVADIGSWQKNTKVAAYVMEGATGKVVGGANYPGFNPNNFTQYSQDILENIFLKPTIIPDKFRLLLRDAASIYNITEAGVTMCPWSVQAFKTNLGNQLRLWDWLGLTEQWSTDFSAYSLPAQDDIPSYRPFLKSQLQAYGLVPEVSTPLKILTAMTGILSSGDKIRPHVVAAVVDSESGQEYLLPGYENESKRFSANIAKGAKEIKQLLKCQSTPVSSGTLIFQDENLMVAPSVSGQKFLSSEMMFVLIPADSSPLTMLVTIERQKEFPLAKKILQRKSLEKRVGQIVDRISVLQQVAKNVSDVVEIEMRGEGNYPLKATGDTLTSPKVTRPKAVKTAVGIMPDLKGLSLRRSFQLLQGRNVTIRFQGTGRVVSQEPPPGTPLKGLSGCFLILEKTEDMKLEKLVGSDS